MMENKDKILNTALILFSKKGYDAVGVQEIAVESGITKPTLYHYYNSKRGLLDAILNKYFNELYEIVLKTAKYEHDITLTLNKITKAFFYFADKNRMFYRMQLSMVFASPESEAREAVHKYNEKIFNIIKNLFKEASMDHGNMKGREKRYAVTFLGMINNYIGFFLNDFINISDQLIYDAVHQFMHGIFS